MLACFRHEPALSASPSQQTSMQALRLFERKAGLMKKMIVVMAAVVFAAIAPVAGTFLLGPTPGVAHADPTSPGGFIGPDDEDCPTSKEFHAKYPGAIWEPGCRQEQHNRCITDPRCHVPGMPYPSAQNPARTPAPGEVPSAAAPRNVGSVPAPKNIDAPAHAVEAAKKGPATTVDPANPPSHPDTKNFLQRVQDLITKHHNVDVVNVNNQEFARPRHWGYVDYDAYHRPNLYNPLIEAMTFRYHYAGGYREVYVAAGARVTLNVSVVGVFPFTAVSDNYVASGSFNGGAWIPPEGWTGPPPPDYTPPAPPTVYTDVTARIPATNQTVQVGNVLVVGHDGSQPAGSQDTFMLDDSTLAWGQVNDPRNGGQITLVRTQSLPGVGPIDNGGFLTALAAQREPSRSPWPLVLAIGGAVAVLVVGLGALLVIRRRRQALPEDATLSDAQTEPAD